MVIDIWDFDFWYFVMYIVCIYGREFFLLMLYMVFVCF